MSFCSNIRLQLPESAVASSKHSRCRWMVGFALAELATPRQPEMIGQGLLATGDVILVEPNGVLLFKRWDKSS